jgi:hypothetical protein
MQEADNSLEYLHFKHFSHSCEDIIIVLGTNQEIRKLIQGYMASDRPGFRYLLDPTTPYWVLSGIEVKGKRHIKTNRMH